MLTDREMQVCSLLELTRREIGQELGISHRTVQAHLKSIFDKLGVNSRVQVERWWKSYVGVGVDGDTQGQTNPKCPVMPVWRSRVAHQGGSLEIAGSNPDHRMSRVRTGTPTSVLRRERSALSFTPTGEAVSANLPTQVSVQQFAGVGSTDRALPVHSLPVAQGLTRGVTQGDDAAARQWDGTGDLTQTPAMHSTTSRAVAIQDLKKAA